jgi:hypothetical protein
MQAALVEFGLEDEDEDDFEYEGDIEDLQNN